MISSWSTCHKILHISMFITSFGEQNITYRCCSNLRSHLWSFLMNLQYDRIEQLCQKLNLPAIASQWSHHAQQTLGQDGSYADFVEAILTHEYAARQQRSQQVLMKLSGLP